MKTSIIYILSLSILLQACAGVQKPTSLENYESQFPVLPIPTEDSIDPIELVEAPQRQDNPDENAFSLRITEGAAAPFSGLLLSDSAAAFIITEYQAQGERFSLALEAQRQKATARLVLDNQRLTLQINGERERFLVAIRTQQQQILDLRQLNEDANSVWPKFWVGLAGFGVGTIIGLIVGLVATN